MVKINHIRGISMKNVKPFFCLSILMAFSLILGSCNSSGTSKNTTTTTSIPTSITSSNQGSGGGNPTSQSTSESAHVHTFAMSWTFDGSSHWHASTCGHNVKDSYEEHRFGAWIIDQEATEDKAGSKHKICEVCGYRVDQIIDKLVHQHTPGSPMEENVVPATCVETGSYDLVTYCSSCGEEISREHKIIPATEHPFGEPIYTWSNDYSSCTAKRVCENSINHFQEETVASVYKVISEPDCENDGSATYTVTFTNAAFAKQTHNVVLAALGHTWGTPTYEWNSDFSKCTATVVCDLDSTHVRSETVDSSYVELTPATTENVGLGRYTASFADSLFENQTRDYEIPVIVPFAPTYDSVNKTVEYGLYPRSAVLYNNALISALDALDDSAIDPKSGFYLYNDQYYAKTVANPYTTQIPNPTFDDAGSITIGASYWFRCEPIVWNVLSEDNGKLLLLSKQVLDCGKYSENYGTRIIDDKEIKSNNYKYSDIRTWLNETFYNTAFFKNSSNILETEVDNSAETTMTQPNRNECDNTLDKVFLLSYQDYMNEDYGFTSTTSKTSTRYAKTTDWSRCNGVVSSIDKEDSWTRFHNGPYWTRSASHGSFIEANAVGANGVNLNTFEVTTTSMGIRPAITIQL